MKKFGLTLILFSIPLFILGGLGDYFINRALRKSNHKYYIVWNDLVSGNLNSEVLVYGTSRARAHINSKILEDSLKLSTYNLGIDGYTFDMEYCRHRLVLEKNKNALSYFTFLYFSSSNFLDYLCFIRFITI